MPLKSELLNILGDFREISDWLNGYSTKTEQQQLIRSKMCSNQNYAPTQERICRVFVIQDQQGNQLRRFQINIAEFLMCSEINLTRIFSLMSDKGLTLTDRSFYLPILNLLYQKDCQQIYVPIKSLNERIIKVIEQSTVDNVSQELVSEPPEEREPLKRQKEPERVIKSVLENVKLWRHMHTKNRKLSLTEAAKLIGISKKTLDDYFLQLRLGELYHFNFEENLNQKVGVLRAHIRSHEVKELETRLPKHIQSFEFVKDVQELQQQLHQDNAEKHVTSHTGEPADSDQEPLFTLQGLI